MLLFLNSVGVSPVIFLNVLEKTTEDKKPTCNATSYSDIATASDIYTQLDFNSKIASANAIIGVYPAG